MNAILLEEKNKLNGIMVIKVLILEEREKMLLCKVSFPCMLIS